MVVVNAAAPSTLICMPKKISILQPIKALFCVCVYYEIVLCRLVRAGFVSFIPIRIHTENILIKKMCFRENGEKITEKRKTQCI